MAMYTEEIVAIHENHEELKEEVKQVKEKVNKHSNWLDKLKENC
jgi:cell division septum initiation protein DivIVA